MISKAFFDDCGLALLSAWLICLLLAVTKDGCSTAPLLLSPRLPDGHLAVFLLCQWSLGAAFRYLFTQVSKWTAKQTCRTEPPLIGTLEASCPCDLDASPVFRSSLITVAVAN